ncbi:MAG TPA: hypothetical protein VF525_09825 [Pyrinomonadaceae bacterium]|jgi:hypothetical protein
MFRYCLLSCLLFGALIIPITAQTVPQVPPAERSLGRHDDTRDPAQEPRQEMLREMEIKRAENTHKQNLERAKESAQLTTELRDTFKQQQTLGQPDLKKLGRVEKLARQLRSESGGSDDEEPLKDPPKDLATTLARMTELTEELRKSIEKTPRQVISASIIAQTNELIELVRLARNFVQ